MDSLWAFYRCPAPSPLGEMAGGAGPLRQGPGQTRASGAQAALVTPPVHSREHLRLLVTFTEHHCVPGCVRGLRFTLLDLYSRGGRRPGSPRCGGGTELSAGAG